MTDRAEADILQQQKAARPSMSHPALFTPITLRGVTFRNRTVVSPMCQYMAVEGEPQDWHMAHHARFALGGLGACLLEATAVTRDGRITHGCTGLWDDAQIAPMSRLAALHRSHGVVPGVQISHSGGKGATQRPWEGAGPLPEEGPEPMWEIIGPSAVKIRSNFRTPRPATAAEIADVIHAFGLAARRAVKAGFQIIELHGAHGYLIHSFMSPITNQRTDGYGGSLEGRMRLALDAAREVRRNAPEDVVVGYRASVVDNLEGGITVDDTVRLAGELKQLGVDFIDCSAGGIALPVSQLPSMVGEAYQAPLAEAVRKGAGIATMAVGMITDPVRANAIIESGQADFVALGRELLADAAWPYRAAVKLGLENPDRVLPMQYAMYLERRAAAQGR
jgi:2,4-dienoyl-CoA reductase-like NADH-dependent reductase (Old Yellow Enzyme family)